MTVSICGPSIVPKGKLGKRSILEKNIFEASAQGLSGFILNDKKVVRQAHHDIRFYAIFFTH